MSSVSLDRRDRTAATVAAAALVAALIMIVVFQFQKLVANPGDPYGFGAIARGLAEHGLTVLTRRAASLYPEFIARVYMLGGNDTVVILLQALMHVASCLLVLSLGRRIFNARTGAVAGLLCAVHPMLLRYVPDLHAESFLVLMCMLTVWLAVRFHDHPTVANGVLLGFVGMCAALTKGVALPYLGVFSVIAGITALRKRSKEEMIAVAALFVTMAVTLAPWTYRNYQITGGRFVLLTPGVSDNFLRGYIFTRWEFATLKLPPYTFAEIESMELFRKIARENGTEWEKDEVVDEENNKRVAKHMILTQPLDTIRKVVVGLFTFWYQMTSLTNSLVAGILAVLAWIFAAIGLQRARLEGRTAWLIWLPIVVMNVFVALLIPLGRYSVPILPCLMILAAFGIDTVLNRRGIIDKTFARKD